MGGLRLKLVALGYGARALALKHALAAGLALGLTGTAAAEVTIAALGDSLTQGYGLAQGEGFVPQLESWLRAQGAEVRVLNAGVSGDTTAGGLSRVGWTLTPEVDAMIVALGGNDLLRGIDPANSRANLRAILQAAQTAGVEVLLVGLNAPGNYGPDYKAAFDTMYPELAAEFGTLHFESFLKGLTDLPDRDGAMRDYMQPDGIHPSAAGVARIVEAMGPAVLDLLARVQQAGE
ncbi:arylesterase [Rhodovulum strictum]|uniref:Arylesterase n=1 Tax=Rhodovulum strictum TaxID=58314 RepID=A0A844BPG7_9RHOB|nr:arylesterase [Rhodovulum strictum]MRH22833.1 arylesterase [Rhodovulum strictum]